MSKANVKSENNLKPEDENTMEEVNNCDISIVKEFAKETSTGSGRYYKQNYRKAWELLPEFHGWLKEVPDNSSLAFCKICNKNLHAHRLTLLKHTASLRHMKRAQAQYKAKQLLEAAKLCETTVNNPKVVRIDVSIDPKELEVDCNDNDDNSSTITNSLEQNNELLPTAANNISDEVSDKSVPTSPSPLVQSPLTTHVLDTAKGLPVPDLPISLYQLIEGRWTYINEAYTNPDGRCTNLVAQNVLKPGRFKLHFNTDKYYELRNSDRLFPFIEIVFDIRSPTDHLHIPLLMTPYGYTTYRGS